MISRYDAMLDKTLQLKRDFISNRIAEFSETPEQAEQAYKQHITKLLLECLPMLSNVLKRVQK